MTDPDGKEHQILQARWLTGLLAVAFAVTDLALFEYATWDRILQHKWIGYISIGSAFGQTALISTVLVWSRLPIVIRILACSACLAFLAVLGNRGEANNKLWSAEWFGGLVLFGLLSLIPFLLLRWRGFSLTLADEIGAYQLADPRNSGARFILQFSIWGIMVATTVCAVLLTAARFAEFPVQTMLEYYVVFLTLLITAVVTWWVILLPRGEVPFPPFVAMVGLIAWYMLGSFVLKRAMETNSGSPGAVLVNNINGGNVAFAAIVVRVAGFRLVRPKPLNP